MSKRVLFSYNGQYVQVATIRRVLELLGFIKRLGNNYNKKIAHNLHMILQKKYDIPHKVDNNGVTWYEPNALNGMLQGYYGTNKNPSINIDEFLYYLDKAMPELEIYHDSSQEQKVNTSQTDNSESNNDRTSYDENTMNQASQELLDNDDIGPHRFGEDLNRLLDKIIRENTLKLLKSHENYL